MVDENSLASVYRSVAHTQYTMHWMQWGKRAGKGGSRERFLLHTLCSARDVLNCKIDRQHQEEEETAGAAMTALLYSVGFRCFKLIDIHTSLYNPFRIGITNDCVDRN